MLYACDRQWWDAYFAQASRQCAGEFWTINAEAARLYGLNRIASEKGGGISGKPGVIREGGNSGFQALSLALMFHVGRVVLLGYDMQMTGARKHWHGDHGGKLHNPRSDTLEGWRQRYQELAAVVSHGKPAEIINCTRETALTCFPRASLAETL